MSSITLKDIPKRVHAALKSRAAAHGRSLNREAIACLESAVLPQKVDTDELLAGIRQLRGSITSGVTDDLLREARANGRP